MQSGGLRSNKIVTDNIYFLVIIYYFIYLRCVYESIYKYFLSFKQITRSQSFDVKNVLSYLFLQRKIIRIFKVVCILYS